MKNKEKEILISPKHGINPIVFRCYACGGETNIIALCGKLKNDDKAPMYSYRKDIFCDKCSDIMKQGGSIIVEVTEENHENQDKYRTGRMVGIRKEAAENLFKNKVPFAFMVDDLFKQLFNIILKEN